MDYTQPIYTNHRFINYSTEVVSSNQPMRRIRFQYVKELSSALYYKYKEIKLNSQIFTNNFYFFFQVNLELLFPTNLLKYKNYFRNIQVIFKLFFIESHLLQYHYLLIDADRNNIQN
jgi:hypothetical protein